MTDRPEIERLLNQLYAARIGGDLNGLVATFAPDAEFRIAGASVASPIAVAAIGVNEFRPLLAIMIKTFTMTERTVLSTIIDGERAAVHWQVNIFSKITGTTVLTELVDVFQIRDGRVSSYIEFFAPRRPPA